MCALQKKRQSNTQQQQQHSNTATLRECILRGVCKKQDAKHRRKRLCEVKQIAVIIRIVYMDKIEGVVYVVTNRVNSKKYVGQTTNYKMRKQQHLNNSKSVNASDYNSLLHRAIRKYGKENFEWSVEYRVVAINKSLLKESLNIAEKHYIEEYDSYNNGYNMTLGGEGALGWTHNEGTKKFLSESQKGENGHWYGVSLPIETRLKMSNNRKKTPVVQINEDGYILNRFESANEAMRQTGVDSGSIIGCCKHRYGKNTAGGFRWEYA